MRGDECNNYRFAAFTLGAAPGDIDCPGPASMQPSAVWGVCAA